VEVIAIRRIIIMTYKKIFTILALLMLAGIAVYLLTTNISHWKDIQVTATSKSEEAEALVKENEHLRLTIETILPKEQKVLYENPYRLYGDSKENIKTTSLPEVVDKGKVLQFNVSYKIPEYLRPIYDPSWVMTYYRGWIDLKFKTEEARHRLFTFSLGASANYDFTGRLGFEGSPKVDAHRNINFLIYHFEVECVKQLDHQIALVGRPRRTGVQVIALNKDDLFPENKGAGDFLVQLSTPAGHEIDFSYEMNVMKYEYLMKDIQEHSVKPIPTFSNAEDLALEELKRENKRLIEELSKYVPIKQEEVITEKECRPWPAKYSAGNTYSLKSVYEKGKEMKYDVLYKNDKYRRPIYQPEWKRNVAKGWSYVPAKICENLHILFSIPSNFDKQSDLFGRLGFTEKYKPIQKDRAGLLIYNFKVDKVIKYNNQIVIKGVPSRTGTEIISIDSSLLLKKKSYITQAATDDFMEVDFEILKVE
jgi:hypothetical protein